MARCGSPGAGTIGSDGSRGRGGDLSPPPTDSGPFGMASAPDGALWFTQLHSDRIGRITTDGQVTEFPLPLSGAFPSALTTGPDGALWFTLNQAHAIGRISLAGDFTLHPLPTENAAPVGITCGADGALWFVEIGAGRIGRITTDGRIDEFPLPTRRPGPMRSSPVRPVTAGSPNGEPTASAHHPRRPHRGVRLADRLFRTARPGLRAGRRSLRGAGNRSGGPTGAPDPGPVFQMILWQVEVF